MLHSVPPLLVFMAAEAVTDLRDKLTETVAAAFTEAANRMPSAPVNQPAGRVHEPSNESRRRSGRRARRSRRKLFADYLADARAAWSPGVAITPAWVRQVTGCSRGLSPRLAAALAAERRSDDTEPGGEVSS